MTTSNDTTRTATSIEEIGEIARNEYHPLSRTASSLLNAIREFQSCRKSALHSAEMVRLEAGRLVENIKVSTTGMTNGTAYDLYLRDDLNRRNRAVNNIHSLSYCMSIYLDWSSILADI